MELLRDVHLPLLRLFRDSVAPVLDCRAVASPHLSHLLSSAECDEYGSRLSAATADAPELDAVQRELFDRLATGAQAGAMYTFVLAYCKQYHPALHSELTGAFTSADGVQLLRHYALITSKDSLKSILSERADALLAAMCGENDFCPVPPDIVQFIEELRKYLSAVPEGDHERRLNLLVRSLPRCGAEWYWRFMRSLRRCDPLGLCLCDQLDAHFEPNYRCRVMQRQVEADGALYYAATDSDLSVALLRAAESAELEPLRRPNLHTEAVAGGSSDTLVLHDFQTHLAAPALARHNTLVCSPTGSGKTCVATHVVHQLLARNPHAKVLFLVPSTPLLEQQRSLMERFLPPTAKVFACHAAGSQAGGAVGPSAAYDLAHVLVMTPGLFLNEIQKTSDDSLRIWQFDLFVLDEAHHADKEHPLNVIMQCYCDRRLDGDVPHGRSLPQILALTASIGVDKAPNVEKALGHLVKVCAHLDVTRVVHPYEFGSLGKHIVKPDDETFSIPQTHQQEEFYMEVSGMMQLVEQRYILPFVRNNNLSTYADVPSGGPSARLDQKYEHWMCNLKKALNMLSNFGTDDERADINTALQYIEACRTALELHRMITTKVAVEYLLEQLPAIAAVATSPVQRAMKAIFARVADAAWRRMAASAPRHPLIDKLTEILRADCGAATAGRTIVFAKTRELVRLLADYLCSDEAELPGFVARSLTSANASAAEGGQSDGKMKELIERFKAGEVHALVSTTVAEEGLDIAACNRVVKYNHVTNEIAAQQRRGRGRALDSKSILLALEEWIREKEEVNLLREKLQKEALYRAIGVGVENFENSVRAVMRTERNDRKMALLTREEQRRKLRDANAVFTLMCRKCGVRPLCSSADLRHLPPHYVCVDQRIWARCSPRAVSKNDRSIRLRFSEMSFVAEIACAHCGHAWGRVVKSRRVYWPVVGGEAFALQSVREPDAPRVLLKKWKDAEKHFIVSPAEDEDVARMQRFISERCASELAASERHATTRSVVESRNNTADRSAMEYKKFERFLSDHPMRLRKEGDTSANS